MKKQTYFTYICGGSTCTDHNPNEHPVLMSIPEYPGCRFMPIFSTREEAEEALNDAGFDLDRIREIKIV